MKKDYLRIILKNNNIINKDFQLSSIVEYDYERIYHCEEYGCHENNDFCRCTTIEYPRITNINADLLLKENFDEITLYCVDRFFTYFGVYDVTNWEVEVCKGYYGEEIRSVHLINAEKCEKELQHLLTLTNNKKINYVLKQEYGYLLDELIGKRFKVREVNKDDIIIGQKDYNKKLNRVAVNNYKNRNNDLAKVLCLKNGKKWQLIDGYHRFAAHNNEIIKIISN